ncbi:MAG: hydrogenase maturation protease [Methylobacteriaceae bacterium]|nr:hydrogenase maturation protease [Methylobacteriaceae bacterium]
MGGRGVLVLGLGNRLLTDDGVGPAVLDLLHEHDRDALERAGARCDVTAARSVAALLPQIEDARALIVVDAARFAAPRAGRHPRRARPWRSRQSRAPPTPCMKPVSPTF